MVTCHDPSPEELVSLRSSRTLRMEAGVARGLEAIGDRRGEVG